jgi:hypothetical protein
MKRISCILASLAILACPVFAQDADEPADQPDDQVADTAAESEPAPQPGGPKTLSGMSILGNEETPKSLVIVPWKSSEMGDELSLSDTLDDQAKPVDKEVFLRELRFYDIRSNK